MEKMTLEEILKKEGGDFHYIEFRNIIKKPGSETIDYFRGSARYVNGTLESLDIEPYTLDEQFNKYTVKYADDTYVSSIIKPGDRLLTVWKFEETDK